LKEELIKLLSEYKTLLKGLKGSISNLSGDRVNQRLLMDQADRIATMWVEDIRSPLEYKYQIDPIVITETSEAMKHLHQLSRPNNRKASYLKCINSVLYKFDDKFILPIKQSSGEIKSYLDIQKVLSNLQSADESLYLSEAIKCAEMGFKRAAIVMGWCAVIDRIQKTIIRIGYDTFNQTSSKMKSQTKGKYRKFNKEFCITTISELQEVFDTDLILVVEALGLLDGNQTERLMTCFQYRNHSAHPGEAPIEEPNVRGCKILCVNGMAIQSRSSNTQRKA
jgi:hypothetical protein